jgi:serine protease Do
MKKLLAILAVAACLIAAAAFPAAAFAAKKPAVNDLERVRALAGPSVVNLQITWTAYVWDRYNKSYIGDVSAKNDVKEFSLTMQCTGFVTSPNGYIATAGHCVDRNEVRQEFIAEAAHWLADCQCYYEGQVTAAHMLDVESTDWEVDRWDGPADTVRKGAALGGIKAAWSVSAGGVEAGKFLPAKVIKSQTFDNGDGALLKVNATGLPALPMTVGEPEIGSKVMAIGFPVSVDEVTDPDTEPSYKDGTLGSKSTRGGGLTSVYEVSAATSGGMSGGPVVNLEGEVLGFVSFGNADEPQAFNFMRPASTLTELEVAGSQNQLDPMSRSYRTGLQAYFNGDKAGAVSNLGKVLEAQPSNAFARDFLAKAKALPDPPAPPQPESTFPVVPVAIGGAAALAVAGLVVVLLRRRRKNAPLPATGTGGDGGTPVTPAPLPDPAPIEMVELPADTQPSGMQPVGFTTATRQDRSETTVGGSGTGLSAAPVDTKEQAPIPVQAVGTYCGRCGAPNPVGHRFCGTCGHGL